MLNGLLHKVCIGDIGYLIYIACELTLYKHCSGQSYDYWQSMLCVCLDQTKTTDRQTESYEPALREAQ